MIAITIIVLFVVTGQMRKIDFDGAESKQSEAAAVEELTESISKAPVESV